jgi:uncharacterized protein YxeA
VKKLEKAAIISVVVLMISIVPAFAINDTNNSNGTSDQIQKQDRTQKHDQTQIQKQSGTCDQNCQGNCNEQNSGASNGDQYKYQYGLKNDNAGVNNCNCVGDQHKYQYGLKNGNKKFLK